MLRDIDKCYHSRVHDGKVESTNSFQQQDDYEGTNSGSKGILDQVGSFIEPHNQDMKVSKILTHCALINVNPRSMFTFSALSA